MIRVSLLLSLLTLSACGGADPSPTEVEDPPAEEAPKAPAAEQAPEAPAEQAPEPEATEAAEPVAEPTQAPPIPIPSPPKPAGDGSIPKAAADDEARACEKDSDCAVTELVNGSCCDRGCGPSSSYRKDFLPRIEAAKKEHCADRRAYECLAVACMWEAYRAVCKEQRCTAVRGAF